MSALSVIAITGTSRGVGLEISQFFLSKGFIVIGCSRGESVIDHVNYSHFQVDVTNEASVRSWLRQIKKDFTKVDILVCNVGLVELGSLTGATSLDSFQNFINSILVSTFLVCREFSKYMVLQGFGRIINITSIMSELHAPGTCGYASAKKATIEFTKILAREVVDYGVTCNVISPSLINTDSSNKFGLEWRLKMLEMQSIKRAIDATELCHLIEFFASPKSSIVTGQILHTCFVN